MSDEDLNFYLGNLRDKLPGKEYEEKLGYLFDCIAHAHKEGYTICKGLDEKEDDAKESRNVLTAAGAILGEGALFERLRQAETQFEEIQALKEEGRTIEELVKEIQN